MNKGNVLITGASTGIGRACAIRFAELGYRLLAGVRKPADAAALRTQSSGQIEPILLDVTSPESISDALATLGDEPLAGLVNNAGIVTLGPLELLPTDAWRKQFEVNVIGLVAVTKAFLPHLRRSRGRIVNVGSIAGRSPLPASAAYDATKFSVEAISDVLRMELAPWGISVSLIEPGAVATPVWDKCLAQTEELSRQVAPEHFALYERLIANVREEAAQMARKALPVEAVVKAVEHALMSRRPRTRYVIGKDAWFWLLLNLLPDRWRDRLILSQLGK